jgi:hypothetical protein
MTSTKRPLEPHHYTDEEMHNEDVAHEYTDADLRTLLAFGAVILLTVAFTSGLMYAMFVVFEKQAEARDPQMTPLAVPEGRAPRGPRLLTNEPANLRTFRSEEQDKLQTYGWMSQGQGIAHVPIDAAKKLVVQHGLPVRPDATQDPALGTHAPAYGEASGGRTITPPHGGGTGHPAEPAQPETKTGPQPEAKTGQEIKK